MKLKGEFIIRAFQDDIIAIPVGPTALEINGMIMLNDVSRVIWEHLSTGCSISELTAAVTDEFDVSPAEAEADILEFVEKLRQAQLLEE